MGNQVRLKRTRLSINVPRCFRDFRSGEVYRSSLSTFGIFTGRDTLDDVNKIVASLGRIDQRRCYEYYVVGGKKKL